MKIQKMIEELFLQEKSHAEVVTTLAGIGIKVRLYPENRIMLLDYDQIEAKKTDPITIECRSLILHMDTLEVVSRKFDRFFNYGESPEYFKEFSWERALIMEKSDGSIMGSYCLDGTWHISSRGMAFAEGAHPLGGTFADKALDGFGVAGVTEYQDLAAEFLNPEYTYIWEMTGPMNRIVTPYMESNMVLLGVRCNATGEYWDWDRMVELVRVLGSGFRMPLRYRFSDIHDTVAGASALKDLAEGFVLWDPLTDLRMKIKSATYVLAHQIRGENTIPTTKNILNMIFEGEIDEFCSYFPEYRHLTIDSKKMVLEVLDNLESAYAANMHIENQKEFALAVSSLPNSGLIFAARKKNTCPSREFAILDTARKIRMFMDLV